MLSAKIEFTIKDNKAPVEGHLKQLARTKKTLETNYKD